MIACEDGTRGPSSLAIIANQTHLPLTENHETFTTTRAGKFGNGGRAYRSARSRLRRSRYGLANYVWRDVRFGQKCVKRPPNICEIRMSIVLNMVRLMPIIYENRQ